MQLYLHATVSVKNTLSNTNHNTNDPSSSNLISISNHYRTIQETNHHFKQFSYIFLFPKYTKKSSNANSVQTSSLTSLKPQIKKIGNQHYAGKLTLLNKLYTNLLK